MNVASNLHAHDAEPGSADVVEIAHRLAPILADGAADIDENDGFVGRNYDLLKDAGLVEAGVPTELGGGGADVRSTGP
jgi:hypothetical protein